MSEQTPNNDLLRSVAKAVEAMRDQMVTKADLAGMATKNDLEPLQEQVAYTGGQIENVRDQMATKSDLEGLATKSDLEALRDQADYMGGQVETMRDQMATKSDIARLEAKIDVGLTAVRGDIEQVHLRLDAIERALNARLSQIETEVSRLRSVVYLLVKDRPEMLRLLGQTPLAGGEERP
jgi:hypothetical protein